MSTEEEDFYPEIETLKVKQVMLKRITKKLEMPMNNPTNVLQRLETIVDQHLKFEAKAKDLGYASVGYALKALSQYKVPISDTSLLPVEFNNLPLNWIKGRIKDKKNEAIAPLGVTGAERKLKCVMPLIVEAWELADEKVKEEIVRSYLVNSPQTFEAELYAYINDLEVIDPESEKLDQAIIYSDTNLDFRMALDSVSQIDYGVVPEYPEEVEVQ